MTHLKDLKCHSCDTMLRVDKRAVSCQCFPCIMASMPKPPVDQDVVVQLELTEPAK